MTRGHDGAGQGGRCPPLRRGGDGRGQRPGQEHTRTLSSTEARLQPPHLPPTQVPLTFPPTGRGVTSLPGPGVTLSTVLTSCPAVSLEEELPAFGASPRSPTWALGGPPSVARAAPCVASPGTLPEGGWGGVRGGPSSLDALNVAVP